MNEEATSSESRLGFLLGFLIGKYSRLVKFGLVGASGALVGLAVLYLLTNTIGLHYLLLSNVVAFIPSVSNNYYWNSKWTFNDKKAHTIGYLKYVVTSLPSLGVSTLFLGVLTFAAGIWYMFSYAIAILGAFLINYALSKKFVWIRSKV